jgi:hypothetical protein
MALKHKLEKREQHRYARRSTKRGWILRRPKHLWRIVAIVLAVLTVISVALIWGNILKARSDAYEASKDEWQVDTHITTPLREGQPSYRARRIDVGDGVSSMADSYGGVVLDMGNVADGVVFSSGVVKMSSVECDGYHLQKEIDRLHSGGMEVTGVFRVMSLTEKDSTTATYLRGLELSILTEYAATGIDDILLEGIPTDTDEALEAAMTYLSDLRKSMIGNDAIARIGVAFSHETFVSAQVEEETGEDSETETTEIDALTYAKNPAMGKMMAVSDYMVMDLRDLPDNTDLDAFLKNVQYAYVRYGLRLEVNTRSYANEIASHGFERIMEMR